MAQWILMLIHSLIVTGVIYLILLHGFKQSHSKAVTGSLIIGVLTFVYLMLFGFGHR